MKFFYISETDKKETLIEEIPGIKESNACAFKMTFIGTVPTLKVKWETTLGEKGEYIFNMNGFNGNVNMTSYKYKLSFKGFIFKILNIN
ncbi:hypothetical protein ACWN83_07745 [Pseudolactococcus plantarum]|uniref:hypothetical protein n=1 Tax=Pseudolactococcus plantarum TaxID=1365 RepID=UPI00082DF834|nr:hypothetical protein [Lactococcus plantarum]HCN74094.1 hypothetical protein [Lactococcus sp.]